MNIKQAKEEIKHTVTAYLKKDDEGRYKIPLIRQRPVLLMGPPGIGKTQIMEQIAEECKNRTGGIYDYSPHQAECSRTSFYQRNGICRQRVFHNGIYHE